MNDAVQIRLDENYKYSQVLWFAIGAGLVILFLVGWLIIFKQQQPAGIQNQALFFVAIIVATGILIYKRNFLTAEKIKGQSSDSREERVSKSIQKFRRSYIVVWMMAESIALIGVVDLVSSNNIRSFIIYMVVSVYALIINYPRKKLLSAAVDFSDNE